MNIKKSNKTARKIVFIVVTISALVGVCFLIYLLLIKDSVVDNNTPITTPTQEVDYSPPSNQELKETEEIKKATIDSGEQPQNTIISVIISSAYNDGSNLEIRAFINGVIESGGICTAVITKNNLVVSRASEAFFDASTSQCQPIIIPLSEFKEAGNWSVIVNYNSDKHRASSNSVEVQL